MNAENSGVIGAPAREAHRAAFRKVAVRHAMCEDYRAALEEDLVHDQADHAVGRKLDCTVLVLWPRSEEAPGQPNAAGV